MNDKAGSRKMEAGRDGRRRASPSGVFRLPAPGSRLSLSRGLSIIEVIVVIAMSVMIAAFAAPFMANTLGRKGAEAAAMTAVDALRDAQFGVMSGRGATAYGVHFENAKIVLFSGAAYVPGDPDNIEHALTGDALITDISLGGGNEVRFTDRRGTPTATGAVAITGSDNTVRVITINAAGMIEAD